MRVFAPDANQNKAKKSIKNRVKIVDNVIDENWKKVLFWPNKLICQTSTHKRNLAKNF